MAWDYDVPDDMPVDDDGIPRHPERGFPVCGYPKTDAVDKTHDRKREDYDGCLLAAGWGTDRTTGACRNHFGASPGGPSGWRNGQARHLLYSERMNDDDRDIYEAIVRHPDDDDELLTLSDAADLLRQAIGWEATRLTRAIENAPDVELKEEFRCPECGNTYTRSESAPLPDVCTGHVQTAQGGWVDCPSTVDDFEPTGKKYPDTYDKPIERKESHLSALIRSLKQVEPGADMHIDHTHRGDSDEPVEVNISHVGVDLADDDADDG